MKKFLAKALEENNYHFSAELQEKLLRYLDLLQQWNRVFNLTSIHQEHDMVLLHILDSLTISSHLHGTRIIDIGSGAGLPGIPLALTHSEKNFLLLDSNRKKTRFLTHVMHELNITNLEIVHARCENFHPSHLFDLLWRSFFPWIFLQTN